MRAQVRRAAQLLAHVHRGLPARGEADRERARGETCEGSESETGLRPEKALRAHLYRQLGQSRAVLKAVSDPLRRE